ncbi:MAG TPA: HD domain-containing protein [Rhodothermales bacterium]|nr:HD domain-containing protein [Rhodothermales bacterium]HRR08770.1 HD domain-containing protein [Rhodothermales bacterium]
MNRLPYSDILRRIGALADEMALPVYMVGGGVRDWFLQRPTKDLDFVTVGPGSGIRLAQAVAAAYGVGMAHVHKNFGTAGVHLHLSAGRSLELEFVSARSESYSRDSRKPIVEEGTLEEDQNRRDFTINALAVSLNANTFGTLLDPFGGQKDLAEQLIRTPLDPEVTFSDDPLRMMRAARFATQLGFSIHPKAFDAMKKMAERIRIISMERVTDELQKIMVCPVPSVGLRVLYETGILAHVFPALTALAGVENMEGHKHKDNFFHTLQVLDNLAESLGGRPVEETRWLRWAALLHDIGKPKSKRYVQGIGWTFHGHEDRGGRMVPGIFKQLRLPVDERMRYVQKLVSLHHRPVALVDEVVTDSAVRRLLFDAGDDLEDLMALVRADITTKNPQRVARYLAHFDLVEEKMRIVEEKDRLRQFQPPVKGNEIMEVLGLKPGKEVGIIKKAIEEAILEGRIPNEHGAAFAYMLAVKNDLLKTVI